MMKIFKYLVSPLKILFPLIVIVSLIYFRHIIFLPNINSPVDSLQSMTEDKFDITVPVYMPRLQPDIVPDDTVSVELECPTDVVANTDIEDPSSRVIKADEQPAVIVNEADKIPAENAASLQARVVEDNVNNSENTTQVIPVENASELAAVDSADNELMNSMFETIITMNQKIDELFEMNRQSLSVASVKPVADSGELADPVAENASVTAGPVSGHVTEPPVNNVANKAAITSSDISSMLSFAREAYWRGNVQQSESMYLRLVSLDNDNPDIYGELGNVYYAQGKWSEAGKAYYEAAMRFIDMGLHDNKNTNQLDYLLKVIQGLEAESAQKLRAKLAG